MRDSSPLRSSESAGPRPHRYRNTALGSPDRTALGDVLRPGATTVREFLELHRPRRTIREDFDRSRAGDIGRSLLVTRQHQHQHLLDAVDGERCIDRARQPELRLDIDTVHHGLERHAPVPETNGLVGLPPRPSMVGRTMRRKLRKQLRMLIGEPFDRLLAVGRVSHPLAVIRSASQPHRRHLVVIHRGQMYEHVAHIPRRTRRHRSIQASRRYRSNQIAIGANVSDPLNSTRLRRSALRAHVVDEHVVPQPIRADKERPPPIEPRHLIDKLHEVMVELEHERY